jgi:hypothetical protein
MQHFIQNLMGEPVKFEHSYQKNLDENYLSYDKLMYYQNENLFTYKCPVPSFLDYFKLNLNFTTAYDV